MKAVGYHKSLPVSEPEALIAAEVPRPELRATDLLVQVHAVSVNPIDTKLRKRKQGENGLPVVLGFDAAGTVREVGCAVSGFQPGDEVYYAGDITRAGTNSELHAVDARIVGNKPRSLSMAEAAAIPLTALTAFEALHEQLCIAQDGSDAAKTLLIIGGAGGVGSMAIQLGKNAGLKVFATASRPETVQWVKGLGADAVLDHRKALQPQLEALGLKQVDRIFNTADTVGYWPQTTQLIAPFGRICSIVESTEPLDLAPLMAKSASFSWELMFTRSMFTTPDMGRQGEILNEVAHRLDNGSLKHTVTQTLEPISAENLRNAHAVLESGKSWGKLVLTGW